MTHYSVNGTGKSQTYDDRASRLAGTRIQTCSKHETIRQAAGKRRTHNQASCRQSCKPGPLKCMSPLQGFTKLLAAATKHTGGIIYNVTAQRPCISRERSMHNVAKQFISHAQHMLQLTDTARSPVTSLFTSQSNVDTCNVVLLQTFTMHSVVVCVCV